MTEKRKQHLLLAVSIAAVLGAFLFATRFVYGVLGTNDATWVIRTDTPKDTMKTLQRRFSADQRYFDMQVEDGAVRLVADADYDDLLRTRLRWDGGLMARRVDPAFDLPDPPVAGITVVPADERGGRRWRGSLDALYDAVDALGEDGVHAILLKRIRGYGNDGTYETLAVDKDAVWRVGGTLPGAEKDEKLDCVPTKDGRSLFFNLPPDAADALHDLAPKGGDGGPDRYALTAGPATLGTTWIAEARGLIVQLGEDIASYEYTFRNYVRISGGGLPKGLTADGVLLPINVGLAVLHIVVPLAVAALWFAIARRFDRAAPEPWWLVLMVGAAALAMNPLVLYLRRPFEGIDWLDPHLTDRVGRLEGFPDTLLGYFLHAGLPEELVKLLPVLIVARWRKEFDEPIDGILYATVSAIGFSCIEEYGYLFYGRMHASLFVLRATSTPPAHVFFTAISGYALGQGIGKGWRAVPLALAGLLTAAAVHALYDALVTFPALNFFSRVFLVLLLLLFTYLVRRSLRGSRHRIDDREGAVHVRVGSYLFLSTMIAVVAACVLGLRELAFRASPETTYTTTTTILLCAALGVVIGVASYALVSTIPIDAVVDDGGITFSGVTHHWSDIRRVVYRDRGKFFGRLSAVVLVLDEATSEAPAREITIGPLRDKYAVAMYDAVEAHRPAAPRPPQPPTPALPPQSGGREGIALQGSSTSKETEHEAL